MRVLLLIMALLFAGPAAAVNPEEMLGDPALEERAREISKGLRCPVCQNESIDFSDAGVARDLRVLVRERLLAGDSNAEVVDFVVARYGEFVLLKPQFGGANAVLWWAGPLMLLTALLGGAIYIRGRSGSKAASDGLSPEEQAELDKILRG